MAFVEVVKCENHHVKGYIYKLKNRRVRVGFCQTCKYWTIATKRLPTPEEKAEGKRLVKTGIQYSTEAMEVIWMIMGIIEKDLENARLANTGDALGAEARIE